MANKLIVSAAPHITSADSTSKIMGRVCIALLPTLIASVLIFGFQALLLTAVTVAACVVFEYAYCKLVGRDVTISDLSAVVTGLLLAFNLPAGLPVWMLSLIHIYRQLLRQALDRLEPRERHIISLRFGLDGAREQTQKEVADRLGISQSYISRLEKRIIARLKKEIVRMM